MSLSCTKNTDLILSTHLAAKGRQSWKTCHFGVLFWCLQKPFSNFQIDFSIFFWSWKNFILFLNEAQRPQSWPLIDDCDKAWISFDYALYRKKQYFKIILQISKSSFFNFGFTQSSKKTFLKVTKIEKSRFGDLEYYFEILLKSASAENRDKSIRNQCKFQF